MGPLKDEGESEPTGGPGRRRWVVASYTREKTLTKEEFIFLFWKLCREDAGWIVGRGSYSLLASPSRMPQFCHPLRQFDTQGSASYALKSGDQTWRSLDAKSAAESREHPGPDSMTVNDSLMRSRSFLSSGASGVRQGATGLGIDVPVVKPTPR